MNYWTHPQAAAYGVYEHAKIAANLHKIIDLPCVHNGNPHIVLCLYGYARSGTQTILIIYQIDTQTFFIVFHNPFESQDTREQTKDLSVNDTCGG